MTPPCLNSWSGSDSHSLTPAYSSSASSSASTFDVICHPSDVFLLIFPPHSRFLWCPFKNKTFFACVLLFLQPPLIHTRALPLPPFLSHFLPPLMGCHEVLFRPVLLLSLSPCSWLCPIAVLAKQRADETVLNSVICQHIQPRKLHCTMYCLCVRTRVRACVYPQEYVLYSTCDYA